jgi:hypothetical protein
MASRMLIRRPASRIRRSPAAFLNILDTNGTPRAAAPPPDRRRSAMKHGCVGVAVAVLLVAGPSSAAWRQITVYDGTETDPEKMAEVLGMDPEVRDRIEELALTAPSRLVLVKLSDHIVYNTWVDDETCTLPKDSPFAHGVRTSSASYTWYLEADPSKKYDEGSDDALIENPCPVSDQGSPSPEKP